MNFYIRLVLYTLFGILPSLVWLFYYLKKDLHPEPKKMVLKVFFFGALATIPAYLAQVSLSELFGQLQQIPFFATHPIIVTIMIWVFVIALSEEFLKYLVVKLAVFNSYALDEPLDIMLYMVVAALGFAAVENIFYLFSPIGNNSFNVIIQTAALVMFLRFIGATFLHTLCSGLMGYFIALASVRSKNKVLFTLIGLFFAVLLHALYDFSIMTLPTPFNLLVPAFIILCLMLFMLYDFNEIKKVKSICKL